MFEGDRGLRVGTSSWSSKDWVGEFYPRGLECPLLEAFYTYRLAVGDGVVLEVWGNHVRIDCEVPDCEREAVATECALRLKIRMPVVIDPIDDEIARAYGALPDRLYLINRGGRIAYQGEPGPFGFKPEGLETAIQAVLEGLDR